MPFRSAHHIKREHMNTSNDTTRSDNNVNITELVNALRDDSNTEQVELDFDIRHTSVSNDSDYDKMEHVLTLDRISNTVGT